MRRCEGCLLLSWPWRCYHHTRDSDGASHALRSDTWSRQVTWHVPGCGSILPRKCESVQVMTQSDAHSLSDALWYLGFSGTGPKCWWPNCYKSYNSLFLLQMVTKLLIYFFFAGPGAQERGQKVDKTQGVRPVFVYLEHLETRLKTRFNWPRRIASLFCPMFFAYSRHKKWNWCSRDKV